MAVKFADRVLQLSSTTGTGDITLSSTPTGYQSFASATTDGDTLYYGIVSDGGQFEVGYGIMGGSSTTLTRLEVITSSNSNALVNFTAGEKQVFITLATGSFPYNDPNTGSVVIPLGYTVPLTNGGTGATTASGARTALGLGTAATQNTGAFATAVQGALADTALQPATIGVTVQGFDAQTTKNNVANVFTQPNDFVKTFADWTAETFNATQTLNALNPACTTTLSGNMTLNAVSNSNANEMQVIVRAFTQDATGGRTIAYNTSVFSSGSASFPQPNATASRVSLFQFTKMPDGKWVVQSLNDVRST
jgi:hypothetical protein